jgi:hypothetical protein
VIFSDPVERRLKWWCDSAWGVPPWPSPCQRPIRWRICAWLLDTYRDIRGWLL